jgi:hypothetical protein
VRRQAKASSAGSTHGTGSVWGLLRRALPTRDGSSGSKGRGARPARFIGLLVFSSAVLALAAGSASAKTTNQYLSAIDRSAAPTASAAPNAIAVSSPGDVYVALGGGGIEHYDSSGTYLGQIDGSATPRGAMSSNYVAVASNGDVYVSDAEGRVVDRFDAAGNYLSQLDGSNTPQGSFTPNLVAAGSGGDVYVADEANGVIDEFDGSGALVTQFEAAATPQGFFCARGLAAAADGQLYVGDICNGVVDVFEASGAYASQFDGSATPQGFFAPGGATVGADGDLYVGDIGNGVVDAFDASGTYLGQFDGATTPRGSFAPGGESLPVVAGPGGSLYVVDAGAPVIDKFSETRVVVPDATTEAASALDQTVATLNGTVNPDGVQLTGCHFDVVPASQFEVDHYESLTSAEQVPCVPAATSIAADANDHPVTAELSGLTPNTTYHYRLVAANADGTVRGLDETLITLALPSVGGETSSSTPTEVNLGATINPNGTETFYHFEFGLNTSYGTVLPEPDAVLAAERTSQAVSIHIAGLLPETTYHYRIVAHSTVGTSESGDLTFRTAGGLFPLPDSRAWEQVTPLDKSGANVKQISNVADDGNAVVFTIQSTLGGGETNRGINQYVARRTDTGWVTSPLTAPQRLAPKGATLNAAEAISTNLTKALLVSAHMEPGAPPSTGGATAGGIDLTMETLPDDPHAPPTYEAVGPVLPLFSLTYLGGAPDLSTLVIGAGAPLTPQPLGGEEGMYEITETERGPAAPVRRVDVDNSGVAIPGGVASIGGDGFNVVSADGSRIFIPDLDGHVYARTNGQTTTTVSDPSPSECDPSCLHPEAQSAAFAGASEDGTRVYFTTSQELLASDTDTTTDLYEYDFTRPAGHHLVQVSGGGTGDATPGSGADVLRMSRLSDDGSRAAFVAKGVLTTTPNSAGDQAVAGGDNLYVVDRQPGGSGTTKFVGTLLDSDASGTGIGHGPSLLDPSDGARRIQASSPGGRYLVFSTYAQLTPDDTDSAIDVYRFDDQTGELVRVSHAQPGYRNDGNGAANAEIESPVFTFASGAMLGAKSQTGRQRAVSDDGSTIVFATGESLQEVDQNGGTNIYEWHDGAVSLIGDPQDPSTPFNAAGSHEATLSRSGADLFTISDSGLVPEDVDGVMDVYDARIGGGFPFTPPPTPCDVASDSCQPPSARLAPPAASATAAGKSKGNVTAATLRLRKVSASARQKFAETGQLVLKIAAAEGGKLSARATAKIGGRMVTVGSASRRTASGGVAVLRIKLSKAARAQLTADGKLTVKVVVSGSQARASRSITLKLTAGRPGRSNGGGKS